MEYLTVKQVAAALNISVVSVYRLHYDGVLKFTKVGKGATRISKAELERYLAIQTISKVSSPCVNNKTYKKPAKKQPSAPPAVYRAKDDRSPRSRRVQLLFRPAMHNAMVKIAHKNKQSLNNCIEDILTAYLEQQTNKNAKTAEITALEIVALELGKAKGKHPYFPGGAEGLSIITEELGELAAALNDGESKERQMEEAAHVAVTAIRFIERSLGK